MARGKQQIVSVSPEFLTMEEIHWPKSPPVTVVGFGHVPTEYPHYLVVDVYDVFMDFKDNPGLQALFEKFPLHRIIETALGQTAYNHDDGGFWNQFEDRFGGQMELFDLDAIALFFESLAFHLDEVIRTRFREKFDTGNYIFSKWVGPTSLELRIDENNAYFGDSGAGEGVQHRTLSPFGSLP
jgi:hypothetical protein